jgi:hypothetical protein
MGELPDEVEGGSIVRYANGKPTGRWSTSNDRLTLINLSRHYGRQCDESHSKATFI